MDRPDAPLDGRLVAACTLLAPISWGTTYVVVAELLPAGRPLLLAALRVAPAGLVLVGLRRLRGTRWPRGTALRRTAALAACNFAVFFPLLIVAVYRLPGGVAAAAGGLQPLFVAALTRVTTGRAAARTDVAVGVAAAAGVAMVVLRPDAGLDPVGIAAAFGANASFALGVVLTKRWPVPADRLAATGWQLLLAASVLVPLALLVEGPPPTLDGRAILGFAHLSLIGTAAAYMLWFRGIRQLPVAAPPLLGLAAPITGAALGWLLRGEALSPVQLLGFAVTVGAIAFGALVASRSVDGPRRAWAAPGMRRRCAGGAA